MIITKPLENGHAMKASASMITDTILACLFSGHRCVVHVNWSFTRHPAAVQGLMS